VAVTLETGKIRGQSRTSLTKLESRSDYTYSAEQFPSMYGTKLNGRKYNFKFKKKGTARDTLQYLGLNNTKEYKVQIH